MIDEKSEGGHVGWRLVVGKDAMREAGAWARREMAAIARTRR